MKAKGFTKGFTLVELMVTVVIVAILVSLALPSYARYIRKANRTEASQLMLQYANLQEIWRTNDTDYATNAELTAPTHDRYDFFVRATAGNPPAAGDCANANPTALAYTVVACARSTTDQINDEQNGTSCERMSLNEDNVRTPADCW